MIRTFSGELGEVLKTFQAVLSSQATVLELFSEQGAKQVCLISVLSGTLQLIVPRFGHRSKMQFDLASRDFSMI